jgi:hypothetical protein
MSARACVILHVAGSSGAAPAPPRWRPVVAFAVLSFAVCAVVGNRSLWCRHALHTVYSL